MFEGEATLAVEPGIDTSQVEELEIRILPENSMYFGGVQVASLSADGRLDGAADPRRTGAVMVGGG
jgi:gamma-glutamyltranspeptidase